MKRASPFFFLSAFILLNVNLIVAQPFFERYDSIPVKVNAATIANPWAGGLNDVQVSNIDMNLDGVKDLFVFDRTGNKIRTFINKGTVNAVDFRYDPQYESKFPALHDWALLMDYNCDGKEDIYSYSDVGGGIDIYKNISSIATGLQFQKVVTQVKSQYWPPSGGSYNLYVSSVDIPAISDIDNDGDLDIVTFALGGGYMEYHQNQSEDLYGICDSLKFKVRNQCWGYASEDALNNSYKLYDTCKPNVPNPQAPLYHDNNNGPVNTGTRSTERHAGGCELCIDLDADGDKEFIVGDVSFNNLTMLTNGGSPTASSFTAIDVAFPSNNTSTAAVDLTIFPCAFYADVNNDGIKDLIVSPNSPNVSENFNSVVYYKNSGANNAPVFQFQQSNLLQDNMIDVGEGAYPVFFDYNKDGLKDLFIGNYGYFKNGTVSDYKIAQFKNIGTTTKPQFDLITRDYGTYSSLNIPNMIPAFGDMDADGDEDMIIGGYDGKLHYFENTGGAGTAVFSSTPTQVNLKNSNNRVIDVGDFAAPQIVDVDGDGKKDLVIGRRNGKIAYLHHIGSATAAIPVLDSVSYTWGNVNVQGYYDYAGYSHPFVFKEGSTTKLLTGAQNGHLLLYDNIDGNLNGTFNRADTTFMNIWEGEQTAPCMVDITNDGRLDMIVGNYQGGVIFFKGASALSVNNLDNLIHWNFDLFPNPANNSITLRISNEQNSTYKMELYNVMGQLISSQKILDNNLTLNTERLTQGVYVCRVSEISSNGEVKTGSLIKRIIIQH